MEAEITAGGRRVLASGSVVAFRGEPVELKLKQKGKEFFAVSFVFRKKDGGQCPRAAFEPKGERRMEVALTGFETPAGYGSEEPVTIALNGRHRVLLHYRVIALPGSDCLLHYTLYLAEK